MRWVADATVDERLACGRVRVLHGPMIRIRRGAGGAMGAVGLVHRLPLGVVWVDARMREVHAVLWSGVGARAKVVADGSVGVAAPVVKIRATAVREAGALSLPSWNWRHNWIDRNRWHNWVDRLWWHVAWRDRHRRHVGWRVRSSNLHGWHGILAQRRVDCRMAVLLAMSGRVIRAILEVLTDLRMICVVHPVIRVLRGAIRPEQARMGGLPFVVVGITVMGIDEGMTVGAAVLVGPVLALA